MWKLSGKCHFLVQFCTSNWSETYPSKPFFVLRNHKRKHETPPTVHFWSILSNHWDQSQKQSKRHANFLDRKMTWCQSCSKSNIYSLGFTLRKCHCPFYLWIWYPTSSVIPYSILISFWNCFIFCQHFYISKYGTSPYILFWFVSKLTFF